MINKITEINRLESMVRRKHTHTQFLFNLPIFPELLRVRLLELRPVHKNKLLEIVVAERLQAGCCSCCSTNSVEGWRMTVFFTVDSMLPPCCQNGSRTLWLLLELPCPLTSSERPSETVTITRRRKWEIKCLNLQFFDTSLPNNSSQLA